MGRLVPPLLAVGHTNDTAKTTIDMHKITGKKCFLFKDYFCIIRDFMVLATNIVGRLCQTFFLPELGNF